MVSLAKACNDTVDWLVKRGRLPEFGKDGRWRKNVIAARPLLNPDQSIALHYGALRGPLYAHRDAWRFVYELVKSYSKDGVLNGTCVLEDVFGPIKAPMVDVLDELPTAFARLGFQPSSSRQGARTVLFRASEASTVDALPEPYGKWLQHAEGRPRWGKPVELEVQMFCKLSSPNVEETRIGIQASTFAPPILVYLGRNLTEQLNLAPPLQMPIASVRSRTTFKLSGKVVDLNPLV